MSKQEQMIRLIGLIESGNTGQVFNFIEQYGFLTNIVQYNGPNYTTHPVCLAAIQSQNLKLIDTFLDNSEFDPEDDYLIAVAIRTNNLEIVKKVWKRVPTVEAWEYLISARQLGNQDIIDFIESKAGEYHCKLAEQYHIRYG